MAVNGKSKGSTFERKMANLLSARFAPIMGIKTSFRRNPDSGSFFGGSNKRRTETHDLGHANFGDLICPDSFKYSVECKHYKSGPTFSAIVKGKIAQWDTWMAQAHQDAISSNKNVLLIIKYNGVDELVFLDCLLPTLKTILTYNSMFGYRLEDFLALPDDIFFTHGLTKYTKSPIPAALSDGSGEAVL
jgi:hypothetical protein